MGSATVDYTGVANTGNVLIDSLTWGSRWVSPELGPTVITVGYFPGVFNVDANGNETGTSQAYSAAEILAVENTLAEFERYLDVDFIFIQGDEIEESDIQFVLSNDKSIDYFGQAAPPGEQGYNPVGNPGFSEVHVYTNNYANVSGALAVGGYDYITFIHEFGHAMGLAHPHDDGGTTADPSTWFPGVPFNDPFGNYGNNGLNQGIYTTMSYNDAWPDKVNSVSKTYGYQGGLMALDILALQQIYGANLTYAMDDDEYEIPTTNGLGTFYECLWDTGGNDSIAVAGNRAAVIDLRAATGEAGEGGGGFISHVKGIRGGFTIAAGVVIEIATGGGGADTIIGNEGQNVLTGGGGKDRMTGGEEADIFVYTSLADTSAYRFRADVITDFEDALDKIFLSGMDVDLLQPGLQFFNGTWSFVGEDDFSEAGQVRSQYDEARDQTVIGINTDADMSAEALIVLLGFHDVTAGDIVFV